MKKPKDKPIDEHSLSIQLDDDTIQTILSEIYDSEEYEEPIDSEE